MKAPARRYKNPWRQAQYDECRKIGLTWLKNGCHDRTGFGSGLKRAFWNGYEGKPRRRGQTIWNLAAYMAGRDMRAST